MPLLQTTPSSTPVKSIRFNAGAAAPASCGTIYCTEIQYIISQSSWFTQRGLCQPKCCRHRQHRQHHPQQHQLKRPNPNSSSITFQISGWEALRQAAGRLDLRARSRLSITRCWFVDQSCKLILRYFACLIYICALFFCFNTRCDEWKCPRRLKCFILATKSILIFFPNPSPQF